MQDTNRADNYPKAATSNNKTSRQSSGVKRPVGTPPGKLFDSPTPPVGPPPGKQQLQPRSGDVSSSSGFPPSPTPPVGPPLGTLSVPSGKLTGAPSSIEKKGPAAPTNVTVANFDMFENASRAKLKNTQKTTVSVRAQQKGENQKEVR